jgi:hypothetical protein
VITVVCLILAFSIVGLVLSFVVPVPALVDEREYSSFVLIITFLLFLLILVSGGYLEEYGDRIKSETVVEVKE